MAMAVSRILPSLFPAPPPAIPESQPRPALPFSSEPIWDTADVLVSRRSFILTICATCPLGTLSSAAALSETPPTPPSSSNSPKSFLSGIANTKSWFQFYGDGFAIRVPPNFEDVMEPEDYNVGLSLYGDKAKPKTYAARFASSDSSEVLSVIIRPTNQLKITFLEAKDIADLGSLKEAAKIFVPETYVQVGQLYTLPARSKLRKMKATGTITSMSLVRTNSMLQW